MMSKEKMNLIHEQLQKLWLLGDKAAELVNPALDAMKALAKQPAQQERTDYAVHLNHCNIGEYEGVCKYLDDDCPALKHADMKAKWDSPTPQPAQQEPIKQGWDVDTLLDKPIPLKDFYGPAQQEPEHIVHSNGRYSPLLTRMMNERVKSNVKQVIELYDSPEQPAQQEPVECKTLCELCVKRSYHFCANSAQTTLIPSPPANKPWVGLTDEDISKMPSWIYSPDQDGMTAEEGLEVFARAIEAKLKEKNT